MSNRRKARPNTTGDDARQFLIEQLKADRENDPHGVERLVHQIMSDEHDVLVQTIGKALTKYEFVLQQLVGIAVEATTDGQTTK